MRRDSAAQRRAGAPTATEARGGDPGVGGAGPEHLAPTLTSHHYRNNGSDERLVTAPVTASAGKSTNSAGPLIVVPIQDAARSRVRAQNGMGIGAAGDPIFTGITRCGDHAVAFHAGQDPCGGAVSPALGAASRGAIGVMSFDEQQITHRENRANPRPGDPAPTLAAQGRIDVLGETRPRRLTPREWERLQGFPDDYTLIDRAADLHRYEALGNSMAVPVMRWIGERLLVVERLLRGAA